MSEHDAQGRQDLPNEARPQETGRRRVRMAREQRAKQFMPFMPLTGYEEALRAKELEAEQRDAERLEPFLDDLPQALDGEAPEHLD